MAQSIEDYVFVKCSGFCSAELKIPREVHKTVTNWMKIHCPPRNQAERELQGYPLERNYEDFYVGSAGYFYCNEECATFGTLE